MLNLWKSKLPALAMLALLGACAAQTPQQRAAVVEKEVEEMIAVYGPACEKLGYKQESDPWRDCVLRLNNREQLRYLSRPTTTSCIGHRGFFNCTSF